MHMNMYVYVIQMFNINSLISGKDLDLGVPISSVWINSFNRCLMPLSGAPNAPIEITGANDIKYP